jgi:hypothetical protein
LFFSVNGRLRRNNIITTYSLNAFDQYQHLENRLTRALGVTLERSPAFRKAFVRKFASGTRLGRNSTIKLQLAEGQRRPDEEQSGIPDLALIDDADRAIIIESKVNAGLVTSQLEAHERRTVLNGLELLAGLAITGRDRDARIIDSWKQRRGKSKAGGRHVTWRSVYELARAQPPENTWARELADYMEIFAAEMDDKGMGSDVRVMGFSGIPFSSYEDYDVKIAKRLLHALIDDLVDDKKFLSAIGFKKGQIPVTRKRIKNEPTVWDYLAPPGSSNHTENHHFTVYVHDNKAGAALTIPNGTFRKLRNYVKKSGEGEFEELIRHILAKLEKSGVIRNGGMPYILVLQRRYRTMTELYARDGAIEFDIHTITGQQRRGQEPAIREQPVWMKLCEELIVSKRGNTQFQIGVHFPYSHSKVTKTAEFASLIKKSFIGIMTLVSKLS